MTAPGPLEEPRPSVIGRVLGFGGLPLLSMLTPLIVLPVFSRQAGDAGWATASAGEAIGALFGLVISYGWHSLGPTRVPPLGPDARARLYRESLVVRLTLAALVLPVMAAVCALSARPGFAVLAVLMGLSTALVPLSFSWYAVGTGRAGDIAVYDTIPRVTSAVISAAVMLATGWLYIYPLLASVVPLVGMTLFSMRMLRRSPREWPAWRTVGALLRRDIVPALNELAAGGYAALPVPLVNGTAAATVSAAYASADKLYRYGIFVPGAVANIFQRWVIEAGSEKLVERQRFALGCHAALGVLGLAAITGLGPWVSAVLFGDAVTAARDVCAALGCAFAINSVRMGLTRLVLFPAGRTRIILRSTLIGGVVGTPLVAVLAIGVGPVGAALGLFISELVMASLLVRDGREVLRRSDREPAG